MRSLFLKIFLWFALAMVLVNVASFLTGIIAERRSERRSNPLAPMFGVYAQTAGETFERDGQAALAAYLERAERASGIHAVVFDERGAEVSGRTVPAEAQAVARRTTESQPFIFEFPHQHQSTEHQPPRPLVAQTIRTPRGALYTLVGEMPRNEGPGPPPRLGEPGSFRFGLRLLGQHLLPILLVGGLFCYWLASYLTRPIVKLRATTHELADGNLTARMSHSLTRRHDELGYLGREFNLMAERIEALVEAQRRLVAGVSHELRSPLARLHVALGLARRRAGEEATTALDRIEHEAENLNEMIGRLLTLSRLESGAAGLEKTPVALAALVREVAADADFEARSRNCAVLIETCEECTTNGAAAILRSAIENVLRNAVRYTAEGTEVEVTLRCVDDGLRPQAVISVRDHGKGVPAESLKDIFRPFYRVEDARDRASGGTGLGLAITERALHLHGGSVVAANAADGGLVVELRLPLVH